ncbi:MAG: DUF1194 domain-containing protein [Pseudomonadota bacterium]
MRALLRAAIAVVAGLCATTVRAETSVADTPVADAPVDVELMLAVDVSYSMSPSELEIQRRGYAAALRDPEILRAATSGYRKQIALSYVEWSGAGQQRTVLPWTLIASAEDLERFASKLTADAPQALRRTSISSLLDFAPSSFADNGFAGDRRVIDVSGDGPNNMGRSVTEARDELVAAGFAINGLPLMTNNGRGWLPDLEDLDLYYEHCVIGGPLSFSIPVRSWREFLPAVRKKLILELAGRTPEPRIVMAQWRGGSAAGYDCLIGEKLWRRFMEREREYDFNQ